jgi:carbonic anhydrase
MKTNHRFKFLVPFFVASAVGGVAFVIAFSDVVEKHWGYDYTTSTAGPTEWGTIQGDELCALGHEQSPINIKRASVKNGSEEPALKFSYQSSALNLINNGHTVQQDFPAGSTLKIGPKTFTLKQFHFHAPSENQIDGKSFPLELHFVHVDEQGKPAVVVAVLIKEGGHNSDIDAIFSKLPKKEGQKEKSEITQIDPMKLLPDDLSYYRYSGSLTTPPCSEGLSWYVLRDTISMDTLQIKAFTSILGFAHSSRPIQPLGNRVVTRKETEIQHNPK